MLAGLRGDTASRERRLMPRNESVIPRHRHPQQLRRQAERELISSPRNKSHYLLRRTQHRRSPPRHVLNQILHEIQPRRIRTLNRVVTRVRVRLPGRIHRRIHRQELPRHRVIIPRPQMHQTRNRVRPRTRETKRRIHRPRMDGAGTERIKRALAHHRTRAVGDRAHRTEQADREGAPIWRLSASACRRDGAKAPNRIRFDAFAPVGRQSAVVDPSTSTKPSRSGTIRGARLEARARVAV